MNLSIFDVDLLKDIVTLHLCLRDIGCCVLVCKEWYAWFTPTLWRNIALGDQRLLSDQEVNAFAQHRHHVKSIISFSKYLVVAGSNMGPFPNLQILDCQPPSAVFYERKFLCFVETTASLQSLTMAFSVLRASVHSQLVQILELHPGLKRLDLRCGLTDSVAIQQLIQTCGNRPQFEHLSLSFHRSGKDIWGIEDVLQGELSIAKRAMEQMQDTHIQELSIRLPLVCQEKAILLPLLERCPLLRWLGLGKVCDLKTLKRITRLVREKKLLQLTHLSLENVLQCGDEVAELISAIGCGGNYIDDSYNINQANNQGGGLCSFSKDGSLGLHREYIDAFSLHHPDTLTTLNLSTKTVCSFTDFVDLMGGLPKLQSLVVKVLLGCYDENDAALKTQMRVPWVCCGLRRLVLTLDSPPTLLKGVSDPDWKDSLLHQSASYTISQIGQLERLEEWRLKSAFNLLALKEGYLNQLSRLRRLRKLDMHPFRVGIKEVEWMVDHWSSLDHVVVYNGGIRRWHFESDGSGYIVLKRALLAKRPWIRVDER